MSFKNSKLINCVSGIFTRYVFRRNSVITHILKTSALLVYASTVFASPTVSVDTKYYSIYGSSAGELRKEMNSNSSIKQSGNTYDAYTSWYVNWRFNWNTDGGRCYMTKVTSTVNVKFTLPKWKNRGDSNGMLRNKWDKYYMALINHENGHKKFGIGAAEEIESQLIKLSSKSCKTLEKKANALGKNIIDKYASLEKEYDEETNHGMNNGAIFP